MGEPLAQEQVALEGEVSPARLAGAHRVGHRAGVNYDDFARAWAVSLEQGPLCTRGAPVERIELQTMERSFEQHVESNTNELEPFFVHATFSWRWTPIESARTYTNEDDLLRELVSDKKKPVTSERLIRVDVSLKAGTMYGKEVPMPSREALAGWTAESRFA